jgi:hypothetical protein
LPLDPEHDVWAAPKVCGSHGKTPTVRHVESIRAPLGNPSRVTLSEIWSFNGGPVKDDYGRYCPIYDWITVVILSITIVCVFCFGCASNTVCRVQGRLRGRDVPAAG